MTYFDIATRVLGASAVLGVMFAPKRYIFLFVVTAANIDALTTPWLNIAKQILVPLAFAWRVGYRPRPMSAQALGFFGAAFVSLAALGILRSDRPLAAGKFVVYLIALWLLTAAIRMALSRGLIAAGDIRVALYASIMIGVLAKTLGITNEEARFSSFQSAQNYAFLLAALILVLALLSKSESKPTPWASITMGVLALVAGGSRSGFLGLGFGVFGWFGWHVLRPKHGGAMAPLRLLGLVASVVLSFMLVVNVNVDSRTLDGLRGITGGADVGTFNFRETVYRRGLAILVSEDRFDLVWGNGTSTGHYITESSGVFRTAGFVEDPNRTVHNEYLRVAYELGVVGLFALVAVMVAVWWRSRRLPIRSLLFWVMAPLVLLFLGTENSLSSGVGGSGLGCALFLAGALSVRAPRQDAQPPRDGQNAFAEFRQDVILPASDEGTAWAG